MGGAPSFWGGFGGVSPWRGSLFIWGGVPGGHLADLKAKDLLQVWGGSVRGDFSLWGSLTVPYGDMGGGPSFWGGFGGVSPLGGSLFFGGGSRGGHLADLKAKDLLEVGGGFVSMGVPHCP